jgi:hypothetical protein
MELDDAAFVRAFEACELTPFHHADHLRIAWIYLRALPAAEADARMAAGLRRFAASRGASEKYHETLTLVWLRLVAAAIGAHAPVTFDDLLAAEPALLDQARPLTFYSRERLDSAAARTRWVAPDREPLPPCL